MKKFLIIIALLLAAFPAAAQNTDSPLLIRHYDGALLIYNGAQTQPIDFCQPEGGDSYSGFPLVLSPDAARYAFLAFTGSGNLTRIYVCDLAERALVVIEGQDAEKIRSLPTWSPDSARLAWNEVETSGANLQTVVHDFTDSTVVYERTEGSRAFVVPNVEWGQPGLAVYDEVMTTGDQSTYSVTLIDPDSADSRSITLDASAQISRWAAQGDDAYFVLSVDGSQITALNPRTGAVETLTGRLEYYSPSAPEDSLGLSVIDGQWTVFGADFSGSLGLSSSEYSVSIAPDGQALAFVTFENYPFAGRAYTMDSFDEFPYQAASVPGFEQARYNEPGALYVFWGSMGLRIAQ